MAGRCVCSVLSCAPNSVASAAQNGLYEPKIDAGHTDQKGGYGCYLRIRLLTYPHDPSGCAFPLPCWACWAPIRVLRPTLRPWTPIRYGCAALLILAFSLASAPVAGALYLVIIVGSFAPLLVGPGQTFQAIPNPGADQDRGPDSSARSPARAIPWELVLLMACYALLYRVLQNFDCRAAVLTPVVRAVVTFAVAAALGLYLRGGRPDAPRRVTLFLFGLAAAALVLIPFSDGTAGAIASAIASSCWPLFYYLLWILLLDLSPRSYTGALF